MAGNSRSLTIEIVGDASSLERALGKAGNESKSFGDKLNKASVVAAGALGAIAIGAKLGFDELAEGQKVSAQTAAALKSTGGAAHVTAKQVEGLAGSLSGMSGVDDEVIQSGENLLLTFTNIKDQVGKGNDIFKQATSTMLDMSVALGQDTKSSAIQLGKALNDPLKGITALTRVGVSFTAGQKKQIEAMVKAGDTMGAQKLILKELNKEFGGSAKAAGETFPGQMAKAKNALSEMAASLTAVLLPAMTQLASVAARASQWLTEHKTAAQVLIGTIAGLAATVLAVNAGLKVYAAAQGIVKAATLAWTGVQWLLNAALTANPVGVVVVALAALTAGVILAWKHSETFRRIVTGAFDAVKGAADAVLGFFRSNWPIIATLVSGPFAPIVALATDAFGIRSKTIAAFTAVKNWVKDKWPEIATLLSGPFLPIVALATDGFGVRSAMVNAFGAVKRFVSGVVDDIVGFFRELPGKLRGFAVGAGQAFVDGIKAGLSALGAALESAVKAPLNAIISAWNALGIPSFDITIPVPFAPDIHFSTPAINLPDIPRLKLGGITTGDTLAMLHPREAVIPLDSQRGRGMLGGGDTIVHVHVAGSVTSEYDLAQTIRRHLIRIGKVNAGGIFGGYA